MNPIVYTVVGSRGRWFIEHLGGRYGPLPTKREAISLASAASREAKVRGLDAKVTETPGEGGN